MRGTLPCAWTGVCSGPAAGLGCSGLRRGERPRAICKCAPSLLDVFSLRAPISRGVTRSSPRLIRSRHELFDRTRGFYPLLSLPEPLTAVDTCAACDPACCPAPSAEGTVWHTTPSAPQAPSTGAKLRKGTRNPSVASRDSPVSQGSTSKKCRGSKKGRYGSGQGIWTAVLESGPWTAAPGAQRCSGGGWSQVSR